MPRPPGADRCISDIRGVLVKVYFRLVSVREDEIEDQQNEGPDSEQYEQGQWRAEQCQTERDLGYPE